LADRTERCAQARPVRFLFRRQEGTCRAVLGLTLREALAGADVGWRFARRADEGRPALLARCEDHRPGSGP